MDAAGMGAGHNEVIAALNQILGDHNIQIDDESRKLFGTDVFFQKMPPMAIVKPGTTQELAQSVKVVTDAGIAVVPRGGGLSYSAGYLTDRPDAVLFDSERLNRIIEINTEDLYVQLEAGVTWKQLHDSLRGTGLRTPYWGTASGKFATVGGTVSQHSINYGSGVHGMVANHVLGLEVVLANGKIMRTGSWATSDNPSPFARYYGPDLTGLFLGDCGALGIKSQLVMQLIPAPVATLFGAYDFDSVGSFVAALSEVGRQTLCSECYGFDPFYASARLNDIGFKDDLKKLAGVVKTSGIKEAVKVAAAGRRYLRDTGYSLHFSIDGRDDADARSKLALVEKIMLEHGGDAIPSSIVKVMRGTPFPPPEMMFGPNGDRWVPIHGIFPYSRLLQAIQEADAYMDSQAEDIEKYHIEWSYVVIPVGNSMALIEPAFYWRDERTSFHSRYLDASFLDSLKTYERSPEAHAVVDRMRTQLSNIYRSLGAVHMQIGRTYPFLESREENTRDFLTDLKSLVDPNNLMNPGSLGLS